MRLKAFEKTQGNANVSSNFVEPLVSTFWERIFRQSKSNFVQYIPLFMISQVSAEGVGSRGKQACQLFLEKMLSHLVRLALPDKREGETSDQLSQMQAINYLGSLLSQTIAPIPDNTFMKCLDLILSRQNTLQDSEKSQ